MFVWKSTYKAMKSERDQALADMKAADAMAISIIEQHEATIATLTAQVAALEADRPQRGEGGRYKKREG